jgi:hypothetical protein
MTGDDVVKWFAALAIQNTSTATTRVAKKEMTAEQVFQKVLATAMEQMGEPSTNKKKKVESEGSTYTLSLPFPTLNRFVLSKLRLMEIWQNSDPFKYILDSARIGNQTQAAAK